VTAAADEEKEVTLQITTECPNLKALEKELTQVNAYEECFEKIGEGTVYETVRKYCRHAACPVPCGILKAIEVSAGLACRRGSNEINNKIFKTSARHHQIFTTIFLMRP
jgi:hypothetical protein